MGKRWLVAILLILTTSIFFSGCEFVGSNIDTTKKKISIEEAKKLIYATKDFAKLSKQDNRINEITPPEVWRQAGRQLFKMSGGSSLETFVVTDREAMHIGNGFGGLGVTSALPFDVNKDGIVDIVYAYSFGSGINRSVIAWLDLE